MAPQKSSFAYRYFNISPGNPNATCTLCNAAVKCLRDNSQYDSSSMIRHLDRKHVGELDYKPLIGKYDNLPVTPKYSTVNIPFFTFPPELPTGKDACLPEIKQDLNDDSTTMDVGVNGNGQLDEGNDNSGGEESWGSWNYMDVEETGEDDWGCVGKEESDDVPVEDDEMDEDTESDESDSTSDAEDDDVSETSKTDEEENESDDDVSETSETDEENESDDYISGSSGSEEEEHQSDDDVSPDEEEGDDDDFLSPRELKAITSLQKVSMKILIKRSEFFSIHDGGGDLITEGKLWRVLPIHSGIKHRLESLSRVISKRKDSLYDIIKGSNIDMINAIHKFFDLLVNDKSVRSFFKAPEHRGYNQNLKEEEEFMHDFISEPSYKKKRLALLKKLEKRGFKLPKVLAVYSILKFNKMI